MNYQTIKKHPTKVYCQGAIDIAEDLVDQFEQFKLPDAPDDHPINKTMDEVISTINDIAENYVIDQKKAPF